MLVSIPSDAATLKMTGASLFSAPMGSLPSALTDLTQATTNGLGQSAGPFVAKVPAPPSGGQGYLPHSADCWPNGWKDVLHVAAPGRHLSETSGRRAGGGARLGIKDYGPEASRRRPGRPSPGRLCVWGPSPVLGSGGQRQGRGLPTGAPGRGERAPERDRVVSA